VHEAIIGSKRRKPYLTGMVPKQNARADLNGEIRARWSWQYATRSGWPAPNDRIIHSAGSIPRHM